MRFLEYPGDQKGSGGPHKPFSSLSEGVRGVFTINTETGETACALHLKITNVVLTSPEQFARESMQRVQRNREQAAYYWRAHPQVKHQLMNTLLTVALALFVGNQIGKD